MAGWRENKIVGITAGAIFILALLFMIQNAMRLFLKKSELSESEKRGIAPAEEIAPRR